MTIEINRRKSLYTYKISETDPTVIMVRRNRANARWKKYGPPFGSAESATAALLELERDARDGATTDEVAT